MLFRTRFTMYMYSTLILRVLNTISFHWVPSSFTEQRRRGKTTVLDFHLISAGLFPIKDKIPGEYMSFLYLLLCVSCFHTLMLFHIYGLFGLALSCILRWHNACMSLFIVLQYAIDKMHNSVG